MTALLDHPDRRHLNAIRLHARQVLTDATRQLGSRRTRRAPPRRYTETDLLVIVTDLEKELRYLLDELDALDDEAER